MGALAEPKVSLVTAFLHPSPRPETGKLLDCGVMIRKLRSDGRPIDVSSRLPDLISALGEVDGVAAVYLYGSYGTPYQTPLSDVDLALVFRPGAVPEFDGILRLVGLVTGALQEDDVSVTILNDAPLPHQLEVLRTGRALQVRDELAHADFVEEVIDRASDFAIDYEAVLRDYDEGLRLAYGSRRPR